MWGEAEMEVESGTRRQGMREHEEREWTSNCLFFLLLALSRFVQLVISLVGATQVSSGSSSAVEQDSPGYSLHFRLFACSVTSIARIDLPFKACTAGPIFLLALRPTLTGEWRHFLGCLLWTYK